MSESDLLEASSTEASAGSPSVDLMKHAEHHKEERAPLKMRMYGINRTESDSDIVRTLRELDLVRAGAFFSPSCFCLFLHFSCAAVFEKFSPHPASSGWTRPPPGTPSPACAPAPWPTPR